MASWWKRLFGEEYVHPTPVAPETRSVGMSLIDPELSKRWGLDIQFGDVTPIVAMSIATFFGCVTRIADLIASQPFGVYQETSTGREKVRSHQLHKLIATRPNRSMTAFTAKRTLIMNSLVFGNGVATIQRDRYNRPVEITPIDARKVTILEDLDTGFLFYGVSNNRGIRWYADYDVIHLKDYTFDGKEGVSAARWQNQNLRVHLATKGLQEKIFKNGAFIQGFISTDIQLNNKEQAKAYKESVLEAFSDGTGLSVLGSNAKWNGVNRSPVEVQLIETLSNSDTDWHKVWGLPPVILGDTEKQTSFGSGVEQMFIQVTNTVLIPRATEIEQEFDYKCFREDELEKGFYTSINFQNLLRGDSAARGEYYSKMVNSGLATQDEIRAWEEMGPHPNGVGSEGWMQQSYMPLSMAIELLKMKYQGGNKEKGNNERAEDTEPVA